MDEILEKIKKLMRHAESAKQIGSMQEAEAFAAKIQELMMQYNIEHIGSIEDEKDNIREEAYDKINSTWWHKMLLSDIAKYNFVKVFKYEDSTKSLVIGKKLNIENAIWMFNFVKTKIWYAAYYATRKAGKSNPMIDTGQFKKNFYLGAVNGFISKLEELTASQTNATAINALMLSNDSAIMQYVTDKYKLGVGKGQRIPAGQGAGFQSGYETGKKLEVGKPLPTMQKRLN